METNITKQESQLSTPVAKINQLHTESIDLSTKAKSYADNAVSLALECGKLLSVEKAKVGHGAWELWAIDNLSFDIRTAQRYMKLYRRTSELRQLESVGNFENAPTPFLEQAKATTLRQAYIATGIIPQSSKSQSPSKPNAEPEQNDCSEDEYKYLDKISNFSKWLSKTLEYKPIDQWTKGNKDFLAQGLKPIAELFQELKLQP